MKKLLSLILAILLIISVLPMTAGAEGEAETESIAVNVALNRPCFSAYQNEGYADLVTDGNRSTYFYCNYGIWFYVDLGAAYTVDHIKVDMMANNNADVHTGRRSNYSVYLSNTRITFGNSVPADAVAVDTVAAGATPVVDENDCYTIDVAGNTELSADVKSTAYRYVYISKPQSNVTSYQKQLGIEELEVYTKDEVAETPFYEVEVAAFKPVLASSYGIASNGSNVAPDSSAPITAIASVVKNVNDKKTTAFTTTDEILGKASDDASLALRQRVVIDLEEEYPLYGIVYRPNSTAQHRGGYNIYVTNDASLGTLSLVHSQSGQLYVQDNYITLPDAIKGESFRYVVVESFSVQTNSAYNQVLGIADLRVYSSSAVATPSYATSGEALYLTSMHMPVTGVGASGTNPVTMANDGALTTSSRFYKAGGPSTVVIDLQQPQTIDYVTMMTAGTGAYANGNMVVYATNDNDGAYDEDEDIVIHTVPSTGMVQGKMEMYPVTSAMQGKKFRYVCVSIPVGSGDASRGDIAIFDVYTKQSNFDEIGTNFAFIKSEENDTDYSLSFDRFFANGHSYKLIAAAYNKQNQLVAIKTTDIAPDSESAVSAGVSLADIEDIENAYSIKQMLWDADSLRPIVANAFYSFPYVSVSSGATAVGPQYAYMSGGVLTWRDVPYNNGVKSTALTDKDTTTKGGWSVGSTITGLLALDLGAQKKVDRVTVNADVQGQEFYLSNINPNPSATDLANAEMTLQQWYEQFVSTKADENIVYIGTKATGSEAEGSFDLPASVSNNTYKYVVCKIEAGTSAGYLYEMDALQLR